ncbi:MAG: methyltransferase domain-containing protein [Conexivisphaerales archaeon]
MAKILLSKNGIIKIPRSGDINTQFGIVKRKDFEHANVGEIIKTHLNEPLLVTSPSYEDFIRMMKRGPQIITLKDIGEIIVYSNINKQSLVLEIGTGSGTLGIIISRIARKIISYDVREDYVALARHNARIFGVKNIEFKLGKVNERKESFDTVIIDIPNPKTAIESAMNALKKGGYLCAYLPSISQISELISNKLELFKVMQINKIDWRVDPEKNISRPENKQLYHTGFLLFSRKIFS